MAIAGYLIVVVVMSLVCFIAYGLDKRQAVNGGRRVSERTLHLLALLGGWPGALIAQRHFRHKTRKVQFRIVFWMVVVIHIGIVGAVAYGSGTFRLGASTGSPWPLVLPFYKITRCCGNRFAWLGGTSTSALTAQRHLHLTRS
jgi:uncharacterized membrane protein YsdA (DUF1294 family)